MSGDRVAVFAKGNGVQSVGGIGVQATSGAGGSIVAEVTIASDVFRCEVGEPAKTGKED